MTINQTTPASSPLDTLKALVLRNIAHLEYVIDRLGGSENPPGEDLFEFLDAMTNMQYASLGEHVSVEWDKTFGVQHELSEDAYRYDDGSSVRGAFTTGNIVSPHYTRYDGTHEEGLARHEEAVRQFRNPTLYAVDNRGSDDPTTTG